MCGVVGNVLCKLSFHSYRFYADKTSIEVCIGSSDELALALEIEAIFLKLRM